MVEEIRELWRFRYLLQQFVWRNLRVRYKNSALGVLWSIAPPLMQVLVYTFFVKGIMNVPANNYSAYLLCGLIPWTFFSTALMDASPSLLFNYGVIRKVYMPREIIPLATVLSNLIHFMVGWAVYFAAFYVVSPLATHVTIPLLPSTLLLPLLILWELVLVTGLGLWLSALNLFYHDVQFAVSSLFSVAFLVVPVVYPADNVYYLLHGKGLDWLFTLYMLNPVAAITTAFRRSLLQPVDPAWFNKALTGSPPVHISASIYLGSVLLSLLFAWAGYAYFNRTKWQFVERY